MLRYWETQLRQRRDTFRSQSESLSIHFDTSSMDDMVTIPPLDYARNVEFLEYQHFLGGAVENVNNITTEGGEEEAFKATLLADLVAERESLRRAVSRAWLAEQARANASDGPIPVVPKGASSPPYRISSIDFSPQQ